MIASNLSVTSMLYNISTNELVILIMIFSLNNLKRSKNNNSWSTKKRMKFILHKNERKKKKNERKRYIEHQIIL